MKRNTLVTFALLFFSATTLYSQKFFIHLGGGLMNYAGDLQSSAVTVGQANGMIQFGASFQFLPHFAVDYSIAAGKIGATDAKSNSTELRSRNLNFFSNIGESTLTFEAILYDIESIDYNFTPYAFAGIGLFKSNPYTFDTGNNKVYLQPLGTEGQGLPEYPDRKPYKLVQFCIPFGVGVRYAISEDLHISGELGFRKVFTDYIDDVSSLRYADTALLRSAKGALAADLSFRADELRGSNYSIDKQRGNPQKNDSYYMFQIKLSLSLEKSYFLF